MIELPLGLLGYPDATTFALIDHAPGSAYRWLQSTQQPELAFVVIDPLDFRPDYPVESVRRSAGFVGLQDDEDVFALVICTVGTSPTRPTANYLAPIGVGSVSRVGGQVILHETGLSSAEPL